MLILFWMLLIMAQLGNSCSKLLILQNPSTINTFKDKKHSDFCQKNLSSRYHSHNSSLSMAILLHFVIAGTQFARTSPMNARRWLPKRWLLDNRCGARSVSRRIPIYFISSVSHPDLLLTQHHQPVFQITPVLNTGLSLSEPLQLYKGYNAI